MRVTLSLPLMALALASLCTAQEAAWQTWLIQTNKYRCMHDAPFLDWDACVATSAQKWADQGAFQHSDSYSLAPCAGPAGENLAKGQRSIEEAVSDWYSEASEWTDGSDGFSGSTGHFTAMVWRGASKLGCGWNDDQQLFVCRYKGGDQLDCDTPNMSGCFAENVPRRNGKSEAQCEQEARAAIGADADDSPDVAPPETTQPPKPVATTTRKSLRASTTKAPQPTQQWQPSWNPTLPPPPPPAETPTTPPPHQPWQRPTRGGDWWRNRWGRSDSADSRWGHHYSLVQTGDTADGTPMPQPFSGQSGQPYWNEVSMPFGYTASRSNPTPPGTYVPQPPPPGVKPAPAPWGVGGQGGGYTPSQPHQYNVPDKVEIPGNIGGGGPYASGGLWWKAMQDVKKKLEGDPSALPDSLKQLLGKTEQIFGPGGDITAGLGSMMGDYIGEMGGNLAKDSKFGAFQKLLGGNIDSMIANAIGMLDPKAAGGLGGIASKVIDSLAGNFANNPAFKQFKANALGALGEAGNELLKQALPKVTDANLKSLLEKAAPAIQQIIAGAKKTALIETGHHSEEAAATGRRLAEQLLQFSAVSHEEAALLEESGAPTTTPYPWYNSPYGWMMPPTLGPYYTPPSASGYYGFDQLRYSDKDAAWYQKMYGMTGSFGGDLSSLNGLLSIGMKLLNPKGIGGQIGSILMGAVDQLAGPALGGTSGFQAFRGNLGGLANLFMSSGLNLLNGGYGANTGTGLQGALGGVVKQLIGGAATGSGLASNPLFSVFQKTATSALTKGIGSLASAMLPGAGGLVTTLVPLVSSFVNKVMGRSLLQMQTRQHGMSLINMVPLMESTLDYAPAFPSGEVAPPPMQYVNSQAMLRSVRRHEEETQQTY